MLPDLLPIRDPYQSQMQKMPGHAMHFSQYTDARPCAVSAIGY
jgi:hypothetical protein